MANNPIEMGDYEVLADVRMPECSLRIIRLSPGKMVNPHIHHMTTQIYFLLEGIATVIVGGTEKKLNPMESLRIPVDTVHTISTEATATVLSISIPPLRADDQLMP